MAKVGWENKLAGFLGMHPNNLSDIKLGTKHAGAKRAKKMSRLIGGHITVWLNCATEAEVKSREALIDKWVAKKKAGKDV